MERKNVLITGANKGIGFEIARQMGMKGFHVIITGRDESRLSVSLAILRNEIESVEMLLMDVGNEESIKRAAQSISEKNMLLDVIINNAGILLKEDQSLVKQNISILIKIINTNSYGPLRIATDFLALMRRPSRIINISSDGGSMTYPVGGWSPAYCVSKTLLNAITRHLAYELAAEGIAVNSVSPGWVKTEMGGRSAPWSVERGAETPVWLATEAPLNLTGKFFWDKKEIPW